MNCLVTAGPTYEPLDAVRRLTNFSTGRLGGELAAFLSARGHLVTLLIGEQATWRGERRAAAVASFGTTAELGDRLAARASAEVDAVFHAAAVSDFRFGAVWQRAADGGLIQVQARKIPTRSEDLLVELRPTEKILPRLRAWFPRACLVGWKYELDGDRREALDRAARQIHESRTDACVVNGQAYGPGFGLVTPDGGCLHLKDRETLFPALLALVESKVLGGKPSAGAASEPRPSEAP